MIPRNNCPSDQELRAFNLGKLERLSIDPVADHILNCAHCQEKLDHFDIEQLDGDIILLRRLAGYSPDGPTQNCFLVANDNLLSEPPTSSNNPTLHSTWSTPKLPGYETLEIIGEGGMGIVYKGRDLTLNRAVTLKLIHSRRPDRLARFRIEAEAVAHLQHPGIVQIYEIGEYDGIPFLVLEFLEGGSLAEWLKAKPQAPRMTAALIASLARAMQHAHERGVIHRDLKPSNVILVHPPKGGNLPSDRDISAITNKPYAKITDFGLAKRLDQSGAQTNNGDLLGTPEYMAPEQVQGNLKTIGPACDIYALGSILYEMLTGRPPFQSINALDTLQQVRVSEPIAPRVLQPNIPRDLETICLCCLRKQPNKRYATAEALAADLDRFLTGSPIQARQVGTLERGWMWIRRHLAITLLILAVFSSMLIGTISSICFAALAAGNALVAEFNEKQAKNQASAARISEQNAKDNERRSRWTLSDLYTDQGLQAAQQSEHAEAFLWFCQAARSASDDPLRSEASYIRIRSWANLVSRPVAALPPLDRPQIDSYLHPENRYLIIKTFVQSKPDTIWDLQEEQPFQLPPALGKLQAVHWSPDGKQIAVGNDEGIVFLCSFPEMKILKQFSLPAPASMLVFCPDGQKLLCIADQKMYFWHESSDCVVVEGDKLPSKIVMVTFTPDGQHFVVTFESHFFTVYLLKDKPIQLLSGPQRILNDGMWTTVLPKFSQDSNRLINWDGELVNCWEIGKITRLKSWKRPLLKSYDIYPDGSSVLLSHGGWNTALHHVNSDQELWRLPKYSMNVQFSNNGYRVIRSGEHPYPSVRLLDSNTGETLKVVAADHTGFVNARLSADSQTVIAESVDHRIRAWRLPPDNGPFLCFPHKEGICRGEFSPDREHLLVSYRGKYAFIQSLKPNSPPDMILAPQGSLEYACFSIDGKHIACITSIDNDFFVTLFETRKNEPCFPRIRLPSAANKIICHPTKSSYLVHCTPDKLVLIDGGIGKKCWQTDLAFAVKEVVFHKNGSEIIALGSNTGHFAVLDSVTGKVIRRITSKTSHPYSMWSYSPKGLLACGANIIHSLEFWDIESGRQIPLELPHPSWTWPMGFSPDGERLITDSKDGLLRIWNIQTAKMVGPPLRPSRHSSGTFSPDGRWVITVGLDGSITFWDCRDGRPIQMVNHSSNPDTYRSNTLQSFQISPDSRWLFIGGHIRSLVVRLPELRANLGDWSIDDLIIWAEIVSFRRVHEEGGLSFLSPKEWQTRWQYIRQKKMKDLNLAP